ncbi:Hypothetical protein FKW44_009122 [Caligus rogercresseyi]|uniref:Uncharacterized protein n=1 Tax=Caligus rogercresseyi TaxID=217165 RepID=A0A7T8HFV5_CALRO|nr:Hypothetical protein FKW44_009122 [Caligus rogercresseyi]
MEEFIGMLNVEDNLEYTNDVADRARSLLDSVEDPKELMIRMAIAKTIPKDSRQLLLAKCKMNEEDFQNMSVSLRKPETINRAASICELPRSVPPIRPSKN